MDNKPTLVKAENQCRDVIRSNLIAENLSMHQQLQLLQWQHDDLWQKNDLQQDTTTSLHYELNTVHMDLEDTCHRLRSADDKIIYACNVTDNIERKADKAIGELPQLSPVIPSPSKGTDLALRMIDAINLAPLGDDREPTTPFIKSVSFYASLPMLQFYGHRYKCAAIDHAGTIDYSSPFFVFADGQLTECSPSFITTLLWREFVQTHEASIRAGIPLPIMDLILGGRNGVLISSHNPSNEAGIIALLTTPSRHVHAKGYINRVQNTPLELCEECHQKALKLWAGLQDVRCKERCKGRIASSGVPPLPKEPSPHVSTAIWKKWLRNMREHPCTEGRFTLKGVPFVCNGYLNVHVDAARALLTLLLLSSKKSCLGTICGPLRDATY